MGVASMLLAREAAAQNEAGLEAARKLFADAVADESARRYDLALEKFQRVDAVKDTANVRYRIATCLDALGRKAEALGSYDAVERLGAGDSSAGDTVRAAQDRGAYLARTVPQLTIDLPANPPAGLQVRVDDAPVDALTLRAPLRLDVGHHTVMATASGMAPYRTGVTLAEGARVSLGIPRELRDETPPAEEPRSPLGAYVALGVGGALAAGSVAALVLRASNINTLEQCPSQGGTLQCPESDRSAYDAAKIEGPLAAGLGAAAAVAVGVGVWWIVTSRAHDAPPAVAVGLVPASTGRGVAVALSGAIPP
jgi:hypothetical protein